MFGDLHYLAALSAAGRTEGAPRLVDSLSRYAAESDESEAADAGDPGQALGRAVLACRRVDHGAAVRELSAVRDKIWRIGGSHAQRDLFDVMLIDLALRAGDAETARRLLGERLERRPRNAWAWRHLAKALHRVGDDEGAASARVNSSISRR